MINTDIMPFLVALKINNNRDWFADNKELYEKAKTQANIFFKNLGEELHRIDNIRFQKMFRIYRDVRFSKDKSPYKTHFGADFIRIQPHNRGSFYVHIEPDNMFVGGGFWNPNKTDLQRIRRAIELEDNLQYILHDTQKCGIEFGHAFGDPPLKTAPKGFDKEHPRIKLICHKQFLLKKDIDYKTTISPASLMQQIVEEYRIMLPFFDYMTEVLTTNENGESIIDEN